MSDELKQHKLEEVQRIMRKQLAAWCNPKKLAQEEISAINEIIASSSAARYPNVIAILHKTDLGTALAGKTISGDSAEKLFAASVVQAAYKVGITVRKKEWPESLSGETIPSLSAKVQP